MFKRLMVVSAVASALVFSACQDKNRDANYQSPPREQVQPATGGSGMQQNEAIPESSDPSSTPIQDNQGTGGSGSMTDPDRSGTLDQNSTGGSGSLDDRDSAGAWDRDSSLNRDSSPVNDPALTPSEPAK